MRFYSNKAGGVLWLSARDTAEWSRRWPCAVTRARSLRVTFGRDNTISEVLVGHSRSTFVPPDELYAIIESHLGTTSPVTEQVRIPEK